MAPRLSDPHNRNPKLPMASFPIGIRTPQTPTDPHTQSNPKLPPPTRRSMIHHHLPPTIAFPHRLVIRACVRAVDLLAPPYTYMVQHACTLQSGFVRLLSLVGSWPLVCGRHTHAPMLTSLEFRLNMNGRHKGGGIAGGGRRRGWLLLPG